MISGIVALLIYVYLMIAYGVANKAREMGWSWTNTIIVYFLWGPFWLIGLGKTLL